MQTPKGNEFMLGEISAHISTLVRDVASIKEDMSKRADSIALTVKDLNADVNRKNEITSSKIDDVNNKVDAHAKEDAANFQRVYIRITWIAGLGGGIMIALQLLQIYFTILSKTAS